MNIFLYFLLFISYAYASENISLTMDNQDRSIDTSKYDCIVKFWFNNIGCTGTFISENVLITAQHCINYTLPIVINDTAINEYESTKHFYLNYDIGFIKFNNFRYKCSSYFHLASDDHNISFPMMFRGCGKGLYNTSEWSTDREIGCRDFKTFKTRGMYYFHLGAVQAGDSGGPVFTSEDNVIYSIFHGVDGKFTYSSVLNRSHFDSLNYTLEFSSDVNKASRLNNMILVYVFIFLGMIKI